MILPKIQDINKAKAAEKKREIDDGLVLARRVDELRRMWVDMEVNFEAWRKEQSAIIQKDIDQLIEEKDNLKRQNDEARVQRDKLLEPIDEEWRLLSKERIEVVNAKNELFLDKENFKKEVKKNDIIKSKLTNALYYAKQNQRKTEREKNEALNLKKLAKEELEVAKTFVAGQTVEWEAKLKEVFERKKEYEVGITTIEVREKQVDDKEADLLTREQDLTRRIANFNRVEALKQNG